MKWWGWGADGVSFRHRDKPAFADFLRDAIDIDVTREPTTVPDFNRFLFPASAVSLRLRSALETSLGPEHVKDDSLERLIHAYGKGLRDLVRIRQGNLGRLPDLIVYPGSEDEVVAIIKAAVAENAVVIPFGGGTNIAGSLEAPRNESRAVISVDMRRMNAVLEIDEVSRIARIQAGAFGPDIERYLNGRG